MLTVDEVFRELARIGRQRALVDASQLSDAMKSKLRGQLDVKAKELEQQIAAPEPSKKA